MILIVDPDSASGESLARLLRYNGHPAEVIPSPMEALALMHTRKPVAIVFELDLPHLSGLQFMQAVRADPCYIDVPLIVYTSDFAADVERGALVAGAADVIIKGTLGTQSL